MVLPSSPSFEQLETKIAAHRAKTEKCFNFIKGLLFFNIGKTIPVACFNRQSCEHGTHFPAKALRECVLFIQRIFLLSYLGCMWLIKLQTEREFIPGRKGLGLYIFIVLNSLLSALQITNCSISCKHHLVTASNLIKSAQF